MAGTYLCLEEFGGGLYFNEQLGEWESTTFRPANRFILKVSFLKEVADPVWGNLQHYSFSMTEVGSATDFPCYSSRGAGESVEVSISGNAWCEGALSLYRFNLQNLRFTRAYQQGYVEGAENNDNTPSLMGGTCTRIN